MRLTLAALLLTLSVAAAQSPAPAPRPVNPHAAGEKALDAYLRDQVGRIEAGCLTNLTTKAAWEKERPERRRQFLEMMGLWPLPEKTPLKPVVTGTTEGEGFTVERLHFQSRPGLYVTANLYLPKGAAGKKHPAVLYVCGHGNVVENGVSFGSKVNYQYHPAWFAAHGYVCLILDTLQLGEIQGLHHGTYRENLWWWQARGYTPGGVELWNGIRALDYLQSRPEVDPDRIGLTGRSGGGATSWWVAAADDRVKAVVPVAGIADLRAQLVEPGDTPRFARGVLPGHCDCMFPVNTYRWDFADVAALIAPRPLLLGNSDADAIFPVPGYRRLADRVRKVYDLYDAGEKFQLLETKGPHKDSPELRVGINRWMNRWLKDDAKTEVVDDLPPRLKPEQLKVLAELPAGRINEKIHETFVPTAKLGPPDAKRWDATRLDLLAGLKSKVFGGWPTDPPPLGAAVAADVTRDGVRLRAIDFTSEAAVPLRLFVLTAEKAEKPAEVILSVLDDAGWDRWCSGLGPDFADALQVAGKLRRDDAQFAQNLAVMRKGKVAFAAVAPRGIGVTRWAEPGSFEDRMTRRRFALLGQTVDGQRVWDVRRAISALLTDGDFGGTTELTLHGEREAAGIALYAGVFEPAVAAFDLWHLPPTHRDGPTFLNVLRVLDAPQAVALALPRRVTLHVRREADRAAWDWPLALQKGLGGDGLIVKVAGE